MPWDATAGQPIKAEMQWFYSVSRKNVLRGMHIPVGRTAAWKYVTCISGKVFDALLDLRPASRTYGLYSSTILDSKQPMTVMVPPGVAHGFYVMKGPATLMYLVFGQHLASLDRGVRWNSFGLQWPTSSPIVSKRDADLPPLSEVLINRRAALF